MNRVKKGQENNSESMEVKQTEAAKFNIKDSDIEEEVVLPGFRFHPTDEELVGFYLRRKVENKLRMNMELIKQLDIYKYDPWDLPKVSTVAGDHKEWYFFCMRGRKYKNSVRPNRVTRSGFWKATGIDKPVYSTTATKLESLHHDCIGLKKCLVYYRGCAGKGTKTDWMMHEFRLPLTWKTTSNHLPNTHHEAEVWTLCRIFKRTSNYKKYLPEVKHHIVSLSYGDASSKACSSLESENSTDDHSTSFKNMSFQQENKNVENGEKQMDVRNHHFCISQQNAASQSPFTSSSSSFWNTNSLEEYLFCDGKWDELKSIVDFATDPSIVYRCR